MSEEGERTFVSRWSRRKIAARRGEPDEQAPQQSQAPAQAAAAPAAADGEKPAAALPDPETLKGLESEYGEFLKPGVDESLRRTALKRLFADPHFNIMDGLDVYIDDYSKPDPIPAAFLRALNQARGLRLFEDEEKDQVATGSDAATQQDIPGEAVEAETLVSSDQPEELTDCPSGTEAAGPRLETEENSRNSG
jgi:hypothetical protein